MKGRTLCAFGLAALALACARSEDTRDATAAVGEAAVQHEADAAALKVRREASMREAGERGRAAGKREIERSAASEAKRLAD